MTAQVFRAIAGHARHTPDRTALRSGERLIDYQALVAFLATNAACLNGTQRVIGIASADPLEAALADLAVTYAGHVAVHLPPFFSAAQNAHIIAITGMTEIIGTLSGATAPLTLCRPEACPPHDGPLAPPVPGARRIIFTSGSSGTPKGVVIGERQMSAALAGLKAAIEPSASDVHLSLLPMAQLLEQVAGLYLPLLVGAQVWFCPEALAALFGGPMAPVLAALDQARPTTSILVPAVLARLVASLREADRRAPDSLRLLAVGGAAVAPGLISAALSVGLPVHEGYGLSECCAVVALNRPGQAEPGTVGTVLDGVTLRIDKGEIVVSGPTVMEGYLGQPPISGEWRTGDLGVIENGRLVIKGRKDWLIVTPQGRNINPEWIEGYLGGDPRIIAAGAHLGSDGQLQVVVAVTARIDPKTIEHLLMPLPTYARPTRVVVVPASHDGLLKPGGGIARNQLARVSASMPAFPLFQTLAECAQ